MSEEIVQYEYHCPNCQLVFDDYVDWQGMIAFVKCPQCRRGQVVEAYTVKKKIVNTKKEGIKG